MLTHHIRRRLAALGAVLVLAAGCTTSYGAEDPGGEATPTPPPPTLKPLKKMKQPSKPLKLGTLPDQQGDEEIDAVIHQAEKVVWTSLGVLPDSTDADCSVDNDTLLELVEGDSKTFTCDITTADEEKKGTGRRATTVRVDEVTTTFSVEATRHESSLSWSYHATRLPVAARTIRHEIARQSTKPARITCYDADRTRLLRVADPDTVTCYVTHPDNSQTEYLGGLSEKGRLVFATAAEVAQDAARQAKREDEAKKAEKKKAQKKESAAKGSAEKAE